MDPYEELYSEHNTLKKRCEHYRLAYIELKQRVKDLQEERSKRAQAVRKESADELMLLRAQLQARDEEVAKFQKLCVDQQRELVELAPMVTLLQSQMQAKDGVIDAMQGKNDALRAVNLHLLKEVSHLNTRLAADRSEEDEAKLVEKMSGELARAQLRHVTYETALKVLRERVIELELAAKK